MDSATVVISLSSTSSRNSPLKSETLVSVITVSSEPQRIPVSWESGRGRAREELLSFGPPLNHKEKVLNWMATCIYDGETEYPESMKEPNKNQQTTCIRYDFDKTPSNPIVTETSYTESTPLVTYLEETKKSPKSPKKVVNNGDSHRSNGSSVPNSDISSPLSPNSQKIELCSYLKLMKPEVSKENNFYVEYRRSGRVKTLHNLKKVQSQIADQEEVTNETSTQTAKANTEKLSNLKRKLNADDMPVFFLPLPPRETYSKVADFEDTIKLFLQENVKEKDTHVSNGCLKKVEKRRRFKFGPTLRTKLKVNFTSKKISLRSNGRLKNISLDSLILRKSQARKKARKKIQKNFKDKANDRNLHIIINKQPETPKNLEEKLVSPGCDIVSVHTNSDDENVDLRNFVDDMLELDKMSEEHRKSVIESRILASSSITNLINKKGSQGPDVQKAYKIFSDFRKNSEEKENDAKTSTIEDANDVSETVEITGTVESPTNQSEIIDQSNLVTEMIVSEHDYAAHSTPEIDNEEDEEIEEEEEEEIEKVGNDSSSPVPLPSVEVVPVEEEVQMKTLQRSLTTNSRRKLFRAKYGLHNWSAGANYNKNLNHSISLSQKNGSLLRAFYQEYNLIIAQENMVSFWTQSALGNVLGAQNMWIPKGETKRIALNSEYTQKTTMDMVITTEVSVALVELWTKEHKSDVRQVPLADVFATVYFWRVQQVGLDKKALQLERIPGFAEDVQYCILTYYPKIIVSWYSAQGSEKKTKIRSYQLAADFQTVASISEIQPVQHYVRSLHNIGDGDSLIMGCGESKITLWNIEYRYIVATVEMSTIESPLSTLWARCDRGFLFVIQECADHELRLIAINGMNHSWKKLQNYKPPSGFTELKGVCIDNGILMLYYQQGILCWNAQSGELILEEVANECEYIPSGTNVIMLVNDNIIVKHALSHLIIDL